MTRRKRNNYWQERAAAERKWQEAQLKSDADFAKILNRPYQVAADEINKEIANKAAKIGGIQNMVKPEDMAEYERLAQDAVQKANRLRALHGHVHYTDFSDDVNRRLKLYNATMQINQLELLKSTMGVHLVDLGMETQTSIGDKLYGDYLKERKRQAGILGMAANARSQRVTTATLDSIPSSIAGAEFSKRVWSNVDLLKANLDGILATGFVRGDGIQDMTRYIKKRVGDTMKTGSYAAERLARTESARVQFEAQKESLKDNDYKHCKWYAEPGACNTCKDYASGSSSKKYPEGVYDVDDVPDIPVHPNCRCSIGAYWIDDNEIADKPIADKVEKAEKETSKADEINSVRDFTRLVHDLGIPKVTNMGGLPAQSYRDIYQMVSAQFSEHPEFQGFMNEVKGINRKHSQMVAAIHHSLKKQPNGHYTYGTTLKINKPWVTNPDFMNEAVEYSVKTHWWTPKKDYTGVMKHEMGHVLDARLRYAISSEGAPVGKEMTSEEALRLLTLSKQRLIAKEVLKQTFKECGLEYNSYNIGKFISKYGQKNAAEAFAEAYSDESNSKFALAFRKTVQKLTKEVLK